MQKVQLRHGFTLIELLVVVAIIALLVAMLTPALGKARALAKQTVCGGHFQQLGIAMCAYTLEYRQWIPGSPNTTGWRSFAMDDDTPGVPDHYAARYEEPRQECRPVTHVYDWATPLAQLMARRSMTLKERQPETRLGIFECPAVPMEEAYSEFTSSYQQVPSYLTCVYFLCSIPGGGNFRSFGYAPKYDYLPNYKPRVDLLGPPSKKVYLADGTRVSETGRFEHATNGYADYGAWRDRGDTVLQAYRSDHLIGKTYRHPGGMSALFFDGHVEVLSEQESRKPVYWFPSGTNTAKLPARRTAEEKLIVP